MFFEFPILVPANTPRTNPIRLEVTIPHGIITHVEIDFPPGPQRLVGVAIYHYEHQILPTNPQGWFRADDYVIRFSENYRLPEDFNPLRIYAYNEDTLYDHEVIVRLGVSVGEWGLEELLAALLGLPRQVEV